METRSSSSHQGEDPSSDETDMTDHFLSYMAVNFVTKIKTGVAPIFIFIFVETQAYASQTHPSLIAPHENKNRVAPIFIFILISFHGVVRSSRVDYASPRERGVDYASSRERGVGTERLHRGVWGREVPTEGCGLSARSVPIFIF